MIDIRKYGYDGNTDPNDLKEPIARVITVYRNRYETICRYGNVFAQVKTAVYYGSNEEYPIVGDFVRLQYEKNGDSLIVETFPRKSFFSRRDPGPRPNEQAIVANFDTVFIMTSLNNDFNIGRLERYLTTANQSGATPVIILSKSDLVEEYDTKVELLKQKFFGVDVVAVSTITRDGLVNLHSYLKSGKTVVFLGSSGVGKSSLLNALAGEEIMNVNTIREDDSRGRHTTTTRHLIMLPSGAMVIDTPGMRVLGMWDVSEGLSSAFPDVDEILLRGCRFSDCSHKTEPGCVIKDALETGELSKDRWNSYVKLMNEAQYTESRTDFMNRKWQKNKEIAKYTKNLKKNKKYS